MNDLMVFEGTKVGVIEENGEPLFEIYSTGTALGHADIKFLQAGEKHYPRKERINRDLKNAEIMPCVRNGHKYITESQLYDLMLEMKTEKVKPFRKWVTSEVLPSIRKTGSYSVSATQTLELTNALMTAIASMEAIIHQIPTIIRETVKATQEYAPPPQKRKKPRINYHGKIDHLPGELRNEIILMILQKKYTLLQVSDYLKEKGHDISQYCVHRYAKRMTESAGDLTILSMELDGETQQNAE